MEVKKKNGWESFSPRWLRGKVTSYGSCDHRGAVQERLGQIERKGGQHKQRHMFVGYDNEPPWIGHEEHINQRQPTKV